MHFVNPPYQTVALSSQPHAVVKFLGLTQRISVSNPVNQCILFSDQSVYN